MAKDYRADVRSSDELVAKLEDEGKKAPDYPLKLKLTMPFTPKFGGKKRNNSNSGGKGRKGRRVLRARGSAGHVTSRLGIRIRK